MTTKNLKPGTKNPVSYRDMKPYVAQVRGSEEWSYAQETEIVSPGNRNVVGRSIGLDPQPGYNLERVFYNRDRLTEMYIRKHLLCLRDANIRFNEKAVKSDLQQGSKVSGNPPPAPLS